MCGGGGGGGLNSPVLPSGEEGGVVCEIGG